MEVFFVKYCDHCNTVITNGQHWVKMKVPGSDRYLHYHLDPFTEQRLSCWEKHQLERAKEFEHVT
jgi:hypothetical protein